jgi:predicted AlkP superfamily pyrophosphatase or phosphodiesterase
VENKVILISIDGMRPDGFLRCNNPFIEEMMKLGSYTLSARTVFPSVTLPCHMSMFHSVPPERHGVTTNDYMPPVRPIKGLFEQIHSAGGLSAMFYGWEHLRDISRPGSLIAAQYIQSYSAEHTDRILTMKALDYIKEFSHDFVFLYMVETDEKGGHDNGWMSDIYLQYIHDAIDNVKTVLEQTKGEYTVIVTADHGGHDRTHGSDLDVDMIIPMFFFGRDFEAGKELSGISILDLAPTIADIMQVPAAREWEGKSILR